MPSEPDEKSKMSRRQLIRGAGAAVAASTVAGSLIANKPAGAEDAEPLPQEAGAIAVTLKVNGKTHTVNLQPRVTLLDALRERLKLTGAKRICDRGTCGGCTVLKDGKPIYACMMLAADAQGAEITTVEGLGTPERMSEMQKQFVEKDALMCGFCTPGFVVACTAAIKSNPNATMEQIKQQITGNVCRCGTFNRVFEAAFAAAKAGGGA
jgi:xanthine dehydrogenase YagT iron-sulfur-binding subunit